MRTPSISPYTLVSRPHTSSSKDLLQAVGQKFVGEPCLYYWQNITGISLDFHSYGIYVKNYKIMCIFVKDKFHLQNEDILYKSECFMLIQLYFTSLVLKKYLILLHFSMRISEGVK